jgi:branched-chain amino acid aminotransferase
MVDTPYHDRDGFIWYDGKLVPWREANVHVLSHALHYASAVFEGERAYGGEIFELTQHSQRLYDGAKTMDFTIPYSVAQIDQACRDTIKANKLTDCYVRPIAWRGSEMMGVSAQSTKIHLAVSAWDWGSYFPMEQRSGNPTDDRPVRVCPPPSGYTKAPGSHDRSGTGPSRSLRR